MAGCACVEPQGSFACCLYGAEVIHRVPLTNREQKDVRGGQVAGICSGGLGGALIARDLDIVMNTETHYGCITHIFMQGKNTMKMTGIWKMHGYICMVNSRDWSIDCRLLNETALFVLFFV